MGPQKHTSHASGNEVPKLKASKAAAKATTVKAAAKAMTVKAAMVKKHTSYLEDEFLIDAKPAVTKAPSANIAKKCLKDYCWTNVFLPTLSHVLYVSEQPFKDWAWSSDTLCKTVQAVFDISFPNILYMVTQQDCITKAVGAVAVVGFMLALGADHGGIVCTTTSSLPQKKLTVKKPKFAPTRHPQQQQQWYTDKQPMKCTLEDEYQQIAQDMTHLPLYHNMWGQCGTLSIPYHLLPMASSSTKA
ncbi:hypothetical protein EI94DRAFT_1806494 [Lactarius quietus]|nr:hypothetical protein EI94DRAFT_1806494 [Lactarius quietus]